MIELAPREAQNRFGSLAPPLPPLHACGPFLFAGSEKFYVKGATYGTFLHELSGASLPNLGVVERDFAEMAASGINAIRTYTVPEVAVLDAAARHGLRVMVGLPWEQHIVFLDDRDCARRIEERVTKAAHQCAGHPAVFCYAIGNEIPASIVRWLGRARVERFIERLYHAVKREDRRCLVTYVNYPTTEYLNLPLLDVVCFNVYLEQQPSLQAYLGRLQNIAAERPLMLAEVGLDSRRHGERGQAAALQWQLRTIFESGCAGAFVFAWTDEWHRGGTAVEQWDFGMTRRDRTPKPALPAVRRTYEAMPFLPDRRWPGISVIVCAYNASSTLRQCLEALSRVDYPNFEVIVVDDGSIDGTGSIAAQYEVRLISTSNRGLSAARNTGLAAARHEIVAYLDSDAYPDEHWLRYLAAAFLQSDHVGIGGPNLAPPGHSGVLQCFDHAPGGPVAVFISDRETEHIPGCNMAFRAARLRDVGAFDPELRIAGDDVDICWKLRERGWSLGYSHGAVVWHHRRTTWRSYWKQQRGYGRAEALLERKWPAKYNARGHVRWAGRMYGNGTRYAIFQSQRVYSGIFGTAGYQSLETPAAAGLFSLPLMPEWYLVIAGFAALTALGVLWTPMYLAAVPLVVAVASLFLQAGISARRTRLPAPPRSTLERLRLYGISVLLHLVHPLARLWGRMEYGLTLWRKRVKLHPRLIAGARYRLWSSTWRASEAWVQALEERMLERRVATTRGGPYDDFDLEVGAGEFGAARALAAVEEHGAGAQLVRVRVWPRYRAAAVVLATGLFAASIGAGFAHAAAASVVLAMLGAAVVLRSAQEGTTAMASFASAVAGLEAEPF
ncbi:MAG: glycosyltransferase [Candidatus Eremiobacteraeota bacterium]|nr:glycosyltransferase [Candidatus Eremiobacteraeota bacterium]